MFGTTTQTIGVNAAFLNEIKDDHLELKQLLSKLQLAFETSYKRRPREVVYLLMALQDRLAIHFSLEEAYGYCENALDAAPRLSDQAAALRAEHGPLFVSICQIAEDAEVLLHKRPTVQKLAQLAADYRDFLEKFQQHEQREIDLIFEAFDDDVGVGD